MKPLLIILTIQLLLFSTELLAASHCIDFLAETQNIRLLPEIQEERSKARIEQSLLFDPLLTTYQKSFEALKPNLAKFYNDELHKLRFSSYFNLKTPRRFAVNSRQALNNTPFYIQGIQRGTYEEVVEGGLYFYMNRSGAGNERFHKIIEQSINRSTHYLFRLETEEDTAFSFIPTPIGDLSIDFYRSLVLTTGIILRTVSESSASLETMYQDINSGDVPFARKELEAFSLGQRRGSTIANPALFALQEGVISMHQLLVYLSSNQVENLSGEELIKKILTPISARGDTVASTFTRMLPMGLLGPVILRGELFDTPVTLNQNGQVIPTDDFKKFLIEANRILVTNINGAPHNNRGSCQGCPMVRSNSPEQASGIDILAQIFLEVFNYVQDSSK